MEFVFFYMPGISLLTRHKGTAAAIGKDGRVRLAQ